MFDQKTVHPALDLNTLLGSISTITSLPDLETIKRHLVSVERKLREDTAKITIGSFDDITLGSLLIVTPSFHKTGVHAVVIAPSKYRLGFRCWFLNDKIEDVILSKISKHEIHEPYVPLQLKPDEGKRDRLPLLKAREDLRQKFNDEYMQIKGGD